MFGSRSATWVVSAIVMVGVGVATGEAHPRGLPMTPSPLVGVSVEIDGEPASLYPAPDGSGRLYLEARTGRRYAVTLRNRSGLRVGVVLTVDGLNAISGQRDEGRGRMYVLDPWQRTTVRGWRTSLREVRAFTFVDEQRSYAMRSGKANAKMGWIEVSAYRERHAYEPRPTWPDARLEAPPIDDPADDARVEAREERHKSARSEAEAAPPLGSVPSYPGTGWGDRTQDPAVIVSFEPEAWPAERTTLRYEYRSALVALGILPAPMRDRLWEREHAEPGFAEPPRW